MTNPKAQPEPQPAPAPAPAERLTEHVFEEAPEAEAGAPSTSQPGAVDQLLAAVDLPAAPAARPAVPAGLPAAPVLRTARIEALSPGGARVSFRGAAEPVEADLDEGVDQALVEQAFARGDRVLLEVDAATGEAIVVGVVQTRLPDKLELRAGEVIIDADREVVLRAGRAALRLREDGDVELVGSRIVTMSRGLFRLVGRVLRLN
jgi:hypothetical protein